MILMHPRVWHGDQITTHEEDHSATRALASPPTSGGSIRLEEQRRRAGTEGEGLPIRYITSMEKVCENQYGKLIV